LAAGPIRTFDDLKKGAFTSDDSLKRYVGKPENPGSLRLSRLVEYAQDHGYSLGPGLGLVLSFSVGGEHLVGALVDAGGVAHCVEHDDPHPRQMTQDPATVLDRITTLGKRVLTRGLQEDSGLLCPSAQGTNVLLLIGATASWPAAMYHDSLPAGGPIHEQWEHRTFREHLHQAIGLPLDRCHAINDANAAALTLAFEQDAPRAGAVMCVHLSAGIGLGTVHQAIPRPHRLAFVDAHLVGGRDGVAGEIGHCVLEPAFVAQLNDPNIKRRKRFEQWKPLDTSRPCDCEPEAHGHLEAVVGAEAVLDRLGLYKQGDSLVRLLREVHSKTGRAPLRQLALRDVGRCVASVVAGAVAATDPISIVLVGALASQDVEEGMNEQFKKSNVADRAKLYNGPYPDRVGLRGAALAVLRGGLYRGFFDNVTYSISVKNGSTLPEHWEGWEAAPAGAQSGQTSRAGSAWRYRPLHIDDRFVASMGSGATSTTA